MEEEGGMGANLGIWDIPQSRGVCASPSLLWTSAKIVLCMGIGRAHVVNH